MRIPCPCLSTAILLAAGTAELRAETFVVDKGRSRIVVQAKATNHAFTGVLTDYTLKISGKDGSAEPTAVDLRWDFKHLDTANRKRNRNMLKWLDHARTPTGSFRMTNWSRDARGQAIAHGILTIHGVSKEIRFPCQVKRDGSSLTAEGTVRLNYTDFGLPIVRQLAFLTVKPELTISFRLMGVVQ